MCYVYTYTFLFLFLDIKKLGFTVVYVKCELVYSSPSTVVIQRAGKMPPKLRDITIGTHCTYSTHVTKADVLKVL